MDKPDRGNGSAPRTVGGDKRVETPVVDKTKWDTLNHTGKGQNRSDG